MSMNNFPVLSGLVGCLAVTQSCIQPGPARPRSDAPVYLRQHGYSERTIEKVLQMEDIGAKQFAALAAEDSSDVRFLVAQNPHIDKKLLGKLLRDSDDFVRGGAAMNRKLSVDQARQISKHGTHTTKLYLARNPHLPDEILIDLHEKYGMELSWFAMNPKCPQALIDKMRATDDEDALYWLKATAKGEKADDQLQNAGDAPN